MRLINLEGIKISVGTVLVKGGRRRLKREGRRGISGDKCLQLLRVSATQKSKEADNERQGRQHGIKKRFLFF